MLEVISSKLRFDIGRGIEKAIQEVNNTEFDIIMKFVLIVW